MYNHDVLMEARKETEVGRTTMSGSDVAFLLFIKDWSYFGVYLQSIVYVGLSLSQIIFVLHIYTTSSNQNFPRHK